MSWTIKATSRGFEVWYGRGPRDHFYGIYATREAAEYQVALHR